MHRLLECMFFILFQIIVITQASKPRSVNLALETVLEFNDADDIKFIDSIKQFLDKIKRTIESRNPNTGMSKRSGVKEKNDDKTEEFTKFLSKTASILKSLNDEYLKKFFVTLDNEFAKWQRENFEIPDKFGFRRIINTNLQQLKDSPVDDIRRKLNMFSRRFNNRHGNDFITDVLNYFFRRESQIKLSRFLNNLNVYRIRKSPGSMVDLKRIIRSGIEAIAEPLLKIHSEFMNEIKTIDKNFENNDTDSKIKEFRNISKNKVSNYVRNSTPKERKENKILDYKDNHNRVVEKYYTTSLFDSKKKSKVSEQTTSSDEENIHIKTKKNKINVKQSKSRPNELFKKKSRLPQKLKRTTLKAVKIDKRHKLEKNSLDEETKDINDIREPILITIGSSKETDESSDTDSEDESTTTQRTRQKRYKKFTRRQTTKKRSFNVKTTKHARKAFRTTFFSDEGLSIEHFGSLYKTKLHRKCNDNDTLTQTKNTTLREIAETVSSNLTDTINKDATKDTFKEPPKRYTVIKRSDDKKVAETTERSISEEFGGEGREILSENITLTGGIVAEAQTKNTKITVTPKITGRINFRSNNKDGLFTQFNGTSLTTKNLNFKVKPTTVLRRHVSNKTDSNIKKKSTEVATTRLNTTTNTRSTENGEKSVGVNEVINATDKTADDLENELVSIMDKYNTSSTPGKVDTDDFIKETENEVENNNKIVNEMKADFARIFSVLTTK